MLESNSDQWFKWIAYRVAWNDSILISVWGVLSIVLKYIWWWDSNLGWPSRRRLQNTPTASRQRCNFPKECSEYDTKQSDGKVLVMLELWGMRSIPLLPSLSGPLKPRVIAPDRVLSMGHIVLNCVRTLK